MERRLFEEAICLEFSNSVFLTSGWMVENSLENEECCFLVEEEAGRELGFVGLLVGVVLLSG